jgi:hypothetical protein
LNVSIFTVDCHTKISAGDEEFSLDVIFVRILFSDLWNFLGDKIVIIMGVFYFFINEWDERTTLEPSSLIFIEKNWEIIETRLNFPMSSEFRKSIIR